MNKHSSVTPPDDNPEWGDDEFQRARPASEVIPTLFNEAAAERILRPRGRPKLTHPKQAVKLRIDPDIVNAYRSEGDGWQTRMNDALRASARARGLLP